MMSRILVIGGTGNIGQHLVTASLKAGHPTAVVVRPATIVAADSVKAKLLEDLKARGASVVYADMNDHESLVAAIKQQADVVISAVGHGTPEELDGQLRIVGAIKEAGNVKRFLPSEFGCDVEQAEQALEPAKSLITSKLRVRQALKAAGIPHTIICSYWALGLLWPRPGNPQENGALTTALNAFADDGQRAFFLDEKDMSMLAIRTVEDPRTLDKIVYIRPPTNMCSFGQLAHLWEKKTGMTLESHYVPDEELAKKIQESPFPLNFQLAMAHWMMVTGECQKTIDVSIGVEATQLYPDVRFITIEEHLDALLS